MARMENETGENETSGKFNEFKMKRVESETG